MSRLHLISFILLFSTISFSQKSVKKYVKFADEQYRKGDYYYALEYYKLALDSDSTNLEYLWKYAETLRAYKDYKEAEKYYLKVFQREQAKKYPSSILYYALMQKQNKNYQNALKSFQKAQKIYENDKSSYLYLKSSREIESCTWAISNLPDSLIVTVIKLPESVNSLNAEFPHSIKDNKLIFSSLRADSISNKEEVYSREYKTKIYTSELKDGNFLENKLLDSLITQNKSRGNGTYSLDGKTYYFSVCEDESFNYKCQIWSAQYANDRYLNAKPLGPEINHPESNTTMPSIGMLNGKEILFFASDKPGSKGLDIYYAYVDGVSTFSNITSIDILNTIDNDITPWYDSQKNTLYFSSSWFNGFGGHDIFISEYKNGAFAPPINKGWPYNGPANDQYFFSHQDTTYWASNRIGSNSVKNPTCCSDIFSTVPVVLTSIIDTSIITSIPNLKERLPVRLYFHNDQPNAWSWDTVTKLNYLETYTAYRELLPRYKLEYSKGLQIDKKSESEKIIEEFFTEKVDKGVDDLKLFTAMILEELNKGGKLKLSLRGFASPLAPTDYNVNLTKRRISSFVNYLKEYQNGIFIPYLNKKAPNGGEITVEFSPFGEYSADQTTSDNPKDLQKSVYSKAAAIERRIEIESVSLLSFEDQFPLLAPKSVFNASQIKKGQRVGSYFLIENTSKKSVQIKELIKSSKYVSYEIESMTIAPGKSTLVKMFVDTKMFNGLSSESLKISVEGFNEQQILTINFEAK
jgi:tetratricopeptide (TPR) repeat protein